MRVNIKTYECDFNLACAMLFHLFMVFNYACLFLLPFGYLLFVCYTYVSIDLYTIPQLCVCFKLCCSLSCNMFIFMHMVLICYVNLCVFVISCFIPYPCTRETSGNTTKKLFFSLNFFFLSSTSTSLFILVFTERVIDSFILTSTNSKKELV